MNDQTLSCGHPIRAASEMLPDFFGDTPATQKIGTVYCRWCNDVARAEARVKELEEEAKKLRRILCRVVECDPDDEDERADIFEAALEATTPRVLRGEE